MNTNAQSAATLHGGAAAFFRDIATGLPGSKENMRKNASIHEILADQLEVNPLGRAMVPVPADDDRL